MKKKRLWLGLGGLAIWLVSIWIMGKTQALWIGVLLSISGAVVFVGAAIGAWWHHKGRKE